MTDFGRRSGDMFKSDYDTNDNDVVDNASKLAGSTKSEVQNHAPKAHLHVEADVIDLDHDAQKIKGTTVDAAAIADGKRLTYDAANTKLIYETPVLGGGTYVDRGDPSAFDWEVGAFTCDGTWRELNCGAIVTAGAKAIHLRLRIQVSQPDAAFVFRKNGNSNAHAAYGLTSQVANQKNNGAFIVPCDVDRKIEYNASGATYAGVDVVVLGWFI